MARDAKKQSATQNTEAAPERCQYEARMWRAESTGTRDERDPVSSEWRKVPVTHPAQWAIYDVESGVRMAYVNNGEEAARAVAEKWNAGRISEKMRDKGQAGRTLERMLKPGDTVQTILRNCSRSGMSRRISLLIARDGGVLDITWDAAHVLEEPIKGRAGYVQDVGITVGGCGMDMGFHLVYNLSRTLFPDGFMCAGENCPSNDHYNDRNNKRDGKHMHDGDGGYALRHRWL